MVPKRLLPHRISYKPFLGSGPYGDVYGDPVTDVPARVEAKRKLVRDQSGEEVVSSARIFFQPGTAPAIQDLVLMPNGIERPVLDRGDLAGRSVTELITVDVA